MSQVVNQTLNKTGRQKKVIKMKTEIKQINKIDSTGNKKENNS